MTATTCGHTPHASRGLCNPCYQKASRAGTRAQHALVGKFWRREDLLEEWEHLRGLGLGHEEIAAKLGLKPRSLYCALYRAGVTW